jgi:hypothetical protein
MCGQEGLIVLSTSGNMIGWQRLRVTNRSDHQRLSEILRSTSFLFSSVFISPTPAIYSCMPHKLSTESPEVETPEGKVADGIRCRQLLL